MLNLILGKGRKQWYDQGLAFQCQCCGRCCGGRPGYVWVTKREIEAIALYLGMEKQEVFDGYLRNEGGRITVMELSNYDCAFLERKDNQGKCSIYEVRPMQCRTWPFWKCNLRSAKRWESLTQECPGVNRGKHYSGKQISELRQASPC